LSLTGRHFGGMVDMTVADDIEIGHKNKIPFWMFGLLY